MSRENANANANTNTVSSAECHNEYARICAYVMWHLIGLGDGRRQATTAGVLRAACPVLRAACVQPANCKCNKVRGALDAEQLV